MDSSEDRGPGDAPAEEEAWFGNASDTRSDSSSYGDAQEELLLAAPHHHRVSSPDERQGGSAGSAGDTAADGPLGCSTPVHRASLELLGLDGGAAFSAQDTLSSVVSSLYGEAASRALGKPLSSNLRRLLEAGSLKLDASGELLGGRSSRGAGCDSPPVGLAPPLTLSPSSHHAQQLSALARKLASSNSNNSGSASPASLAPSVGNIKQEPHDPFNSVAPTNGGGFVWAGMADKWPPVSCSTPCGSSLSPDSAIQKLKAAANAVLQDKSAVVSSSTTPSSSSASSAVAAAAPALGSGGSRGDDVVRFDAFSSPFSAQSASSTLAALSKKVSERSQASSTSGAAAAATTTEHQGSASSFLSLVSMTSSAALLKEVAARAAGNLLTDKKDSSSASTAGVLHEDVKPLLDKNQKAPTPSTPTQSLELLLPTTPKGRGKPNSQAGNQSTANACHQVLMVMRF